MDSEKDALLSMGDSAPSSPNVPVVQSLHFSKEDLGATTTSTPLGLPVIEVEAGTPDQVSPSRHRQDHFDSSRLHHSGSRHSLSKILTQQQQQKKKQRKQKSSQLPAHGEVQRMEQSLLKLLREFNSGELRGFDSAYSLEQMETVRDQQEALARKHFELGAQQDLHPLLSDDGLKLASENMSQLITGLEKLSVAIGNLSCLDRMVDPGIRVLDEVDRSSRRHEKGTPLSREDSAQYSRRSTVSSGHTESSQLNLEERIPDICITRIHEESGQELLHSEDDLRRGGKISDSLATQLNQPTTTPLQGTTMEENEVLGMSDLKLDQQDCPPEAKKEHVIEISDAM